MKKIASFAVAALLAGSITASARPDETLVKSFEKGETEAILKVFAADPKMMTADLGDGMTSLHYAVYFGNETVVDYVLKNGVGLHVKDSRGLTPVWFSVSGGRPAMLKKLIALGADLKVRRSCRGRSDEDRAAGFPSVGQDLPATGDRSELPGHWPHQVLRFWR